MTDKRYNSTSDIIEKFEENNLSLAITVGYDYSSSTEGFEIAKNNPNVYCALGVHPHDCKTLNDRMLLDFEKLSTDKKVVAIGEIGLDYHYEGFDKAVQQDAFIRQLEFANQLKLPVIIHSRDATLDLNNILKDNKRFLNNRGIMHCYSESAELVNFYIDLGFYISFAGPLTYKNARIPVEALKKVPFECLLSETDCPYLTPEPYRGQLNYPYYVKYVVEKMSEILMIKKEQLCSIIHNNIRNLFNRIR